MDSSRTLNQDEVVHRSIQEPIEQDDNSMAVSDLAVERNSYFTIRHDRSGMSFAERTIDEFLDDVAASAVTPSGGAVAAVGGAFGAALCEMVCIHTIERGDTDGTELATIRPELETQRARLLALADEDSIAVDELQAAFAASTDERDGPIAERSRRAAQVPLDIAETCLAVLDHATVVTAKGNPNALADAGTGAFLAHAALEAAVFTVHSNLALIEEPADREGIERRLAGIDERGDEALDRVRANIESAT